MQNLKNQKKIIIMELLKKNMKMMKKNYLIKLIEHIKIV